MRNFIQPGRTLTIPSPAAVASGDVVIDGYLAGIAAGDAATGAPLDLTVEGVFEIGKIAADGFAVGARVYWNATEDLATTVVGSNVRLGTAVEAAPAESGTVKVRLVSI